MTLAGALRGRLASFVMLLACTQADQTPLEPPSLAQALHGLSARDVVAAELYRIPIESAADDASRLGRPGALLLARYHPAPNRVDPDPPPPAHVIGSQFVVTLTDMSHLAGQVTVIGACRDLAIVARIARRVSAGESVRLREVSFPSAR